jgi:hypothetical protein
MARHDASPAFRPQNGPQAPAPHKNHQKSDGLTVKVCALDRGAYRRVLPGTNGDACNRPCGPMICWSRPDVGGLEYR